MTEVQFKRRLGRKIKELRLRARLTQEDIEGFDVNVKQYQRIESGSVNPRAFTIVKLAKAFRCAPNDILNV